MIAYLPESSPPFLGFEISGKITLDQEQDLIDYVNDQLRHHDKLSFLLVLNPDASWGVEAGLEDLKWLLSHLKRIHKVAIVSDSTALKWLVTLDRPFARLVGIQEEHFAIDEQEKAWNWLLAPA